MRKISIAAELTLDRFCADHRVHGGVLRLLFGVVSVLALASNLLFLMAILSMLQATLTLPGIAAIALTLGMAIDANVLINERIREKNCAQACHRKMAIRPVMNARLIPSSIQTSPRSLPVWHSDLGLWAGARFCRGALPRNLDLALLRSDGVARHRKFDFMAARSPQNLSIGNVNWHKSDAKPERGVLLRIH